MRCDQIAVEEYLFFVSRSHGNQMNPFSGVGPTIVFKLQSALPGCPKFDGVSIDESELNDIILTSNSGTIRLSAARASSRLA